ncbi:IS3 family transposase, partial [uncultured Parasutterella sp.]
MPINEACSWLGIHRSTFYRKRQKQLRAEEDDPLVTQISELQKRRNFAYGAKRMAVYLSKLNGFAINHKRVVRLMRLHGLNSRVRPKRRIHYRTEMLEPVQEPLYNVLKRDFSSSGPMTKL